MVKKNRHYNAGFGEGLKVGFFIVVMVVIGMAFVWFITHSVNESHQEKTEVCESVVNGTYERNDGGRCYVDTGEESILCWYEFRWTNLGDIDDDGWTESTYKLVGNC